MAGAATEKMAGASIATKTGLTGKKQRQTDFAECSPSFYFLAGEGEKQMAAAE